MNDNNGAPQGPNYQGPQDPNQPYGQQQPQFGQQGPQHGYGQPPLTPQQQARQQKLYEQSTKKANRPIWKKKRLIFPVGALLLIGACNAFTGGNGDAPSAVPAASTKATKAPADKAPAKEKAEDATEEDKAEKAPAAPETAGIGDMVVAEDWEFTVTKFTCGKAKVGDEYLNKKAQGQYCLLNITVKNNGSKEENLSGDNQKLFDADGREFSSDSEASIYNDSDSALFFEGINPGNSAKGTVIFDVPKDAKIIKTELVGGFLGMGDVATVDLS